MKVTIDTNVPIAANGRETHAGPDCQVRCIEFLQRLANEKSKVVVALDEEGLLLNEYDRYLNYRGQPGVGDIFFKFLHDHMYGSDRVELAKVTPSVDEDRGFEELPVNDLDPSDRKILAIAVVAGAEIINALDTDWCEQTSLLSQLGVPVQQLCPEHGCNT